MQIDFNDLKEKSLFAVVTSLFVLFVVMLPRYTDTAKTWFVLLILTALGYLVLNLKQLGATTWAERTFLLAVVSNFAWIALTFYANGEPGRGASFVWGRHFYLLFLIPLFFLFRRIEIPDEVIVSTVVLSILVSFTDIVIDIVQGIDHRVQGMNMNAFGPVQICLSGFLFFYLIARFVKFPRWLILTGFILGLATIVLSKSRNSWMTFVVLCVFFVFYLGRSQPLWKRSGIALGILLLLSGSYLLPPVKERIDFAIGDLGSYFSSDYYREDYRLQSIGERIELWRTGWKVFLDHKFIGVGVGGFFDAAKENVERYQFNERILRNKYIHNQFVAALATRGLPGLILFIVVLGMPIFIAISRRPDAGTDSAAKLSVILICLTYLVGSLGEDHFEGKSATMFVSVFLALMLARISPGRSRRPREADR